MNHFKNHLFLATPINKEAHTIICYIDPKSPYQSSNIISKFLSNFESYIYRKDDSSQEDVFLKKQLVSFFEDLDYFRGNFSS